MTHLRTASRTAPVLSAYATVTVVVAGANDAPIAIDDEALVLPQASVNVDVLGNDLDIDGMLIEPSTVTIVTQPVHGTVSVLADGSITYTIMPDYSGTDTFTYTVSDNSGALSNVATVTVDYNAPPVAVNDSVQVTRNTATAIHVLANDSDIDGTLVPSSVTIVTSGGLWLAHG